MSIKEKLLKRLPSEYHERVKTIWSEDGLIDNCRYMVYLNEGWIFDSIYEDSIGVKSLKEACERIKEAYRK